MFQNEFVLYDVLETTGFTDTLDILVKWKLIDGQSYAINEQKRDLVNLVLSAVAPFVCCYYQVTRTMINEVSFVIKKQGIVFTHIFSFSIPNSLPELHLARSNCKWRLSVVWRILLTYVNHWCIRTACPWTVLAMHCTHSTSMDCLRNLAGNSCIVQINLQSLINF